MKVTVDIDCTPEEARRFLGLPDVVPIQQAVMAQLQERMQSAIEATTPEALLKAWMPMPMAMGSEPMQQAFAKFFGAFAGSKPGEAG